jgi:Fe(3+) dicitrate transport protein
MKNPVSFLTALTSVILFAASPVFGQISTDSLSNQTLREVAVKTQRETILRLPAIQGAYLWAGKKSEVISLSNMDVNIAEKTPRQVFAKVPGVFVYDMDGAGNQTNISTRSLDPHRGWEFNIRTNGLMTNSDLYGYPASHFSLPFEAVERIELVRGTGALQYGAQFGGMLNYVVKQADTTRAFGAESINSAGSFGLLSTYNAVGGKVGKWQYYAFYSKRGSDGYRDNSASDYDGQGLVLTYSRRKT